MTMIGVPQTIAFRIPGYTTDYRYARARTALMGMSRAKVDAARRDIEARYNSGQSVDPFWEMAVREFWVLHCMCPHMEFGGVQ